MKFSCSYDEADHFGDSCGSAESEEGSDSEGEANQCSEAEFIEISPIKIEEPDELNDYDVEVNIMTWSFSVICSMTLTCCLYVVVYAQIKDFLSMSLYNKLIIVSFLQVHESMYDEIDMEEDQEILRMEVALAQKELLEYEDTIGTKKRRTYYIQN